MIRNTRELPSSPAGIRTLRDDTLVVFLSDTHIGGDPGNDIFESPAELAALFGELATHAGPVELVLGGDFFDFLQIGEVPDGENRASATISRPEYREFFSALMSFAAGEGHRIVYLPGNHDAEAWWNSDIQKTLLENGLVDDSALSYAACFESAPEQIIYCEHGNQFDPANTITDYDDPLDTPFGHHIVTDVTRRIVPRGRITKDLDLQDINKVFPLVTIPEWIGSRLFYDLLGRAVRYMLLPLLIGYAAYRGLAYLLAVASGGSPTLSLWESYRTLLGLQTLFAEVSWDALLLVVVFGLFFFSVRRTAERAVSTMTAQIPGEHPGISSEQDSKDKIRDLLEANLQPPLYQDLSAQEISVFVSGHTHSPALSEFSRKDADIGVLVNSGCWLRQLQPVPAHLWGPPVFVSKFVLTHVRVFLSDSGVSVELWECPKSARQRLRLSERIAILRRLPIQPASDSRPRMLCSKELPRAG